MFMPEEIFKLALSKGLLAVLFVWLFFDSRKESKEREGKPSGNQTDFKYEGRYYVIAKID